MLSGASVITIVTQWYTARPIAVRMPAPAETQSNSPYEVGCSDFDSNRLLAIYSLTNFRLKPNMFAWWSSVHHSPSRWNPVQAVRGASENRIRKKRPNGSLPKGQAFLFGLNLCDLWSARVLMPASCSRCASSTLALSRKHHKNRTWVRPRLFCIWFLH